MIVEHPKVAHISFTGSAATGKKIMATGAGTLKKVTLELGGNDPAIVLPDVDIKDAAPKIFQGAMNNTGQVCVAIKRVFVHESKYEEMVDALAEQANAAKEVMNDGMSDGTRFGPINNKMQYARVTELVDDAKASGARVAAGGNRKQQQHHRGHLILPSEALAKLSDVGVRNRVLAERQGRLLLRADGPRRRAGGRPRRGRGAVRPGHPRPQVHRRNIVILSRVVCCPSR